MVPERTLALWCPDWPFVAAGLDPALVPAATLRSGRVAACSHAARADGVRRGMRRREAQSRVPELEVLVEDPARDARAFEPVVAAVAELVPSVEVVRSGLCAVLVRRAVRYFGGETPLRTRLVAEVYDRTRVSVETGIADGLFAAVLAAREGTVVPPGESAQFLAPYPIGTIDRPDLANLLSRLGLHTLGALAALPSGEVLGRFGAEGAWAWHLASGTEQRVRAGRVAPADLVSQTVLDPPVLRVDAAAFAARGLAETLHAQLAQHGLTCLNVAVEAETESGELLHRVWRHDGTLSAAALADRVRWQLDGWLSGTIASADGKPSAGLTVLRLVPDQLVAATGRQLDLMRDRSAEDPERRERVDRALTRVQGLLGHESVVTAVLVGGRDPAEQVAYVPWTDPRPADRSPTTPTRSPATSSSPLGDPQYEYAVLSAPSHPGEVPHDGGERGQGAPWPGRLPDPAPATVLIRRRPAAVRDVAGAPVSVSGRSMLSGDPAQVSIDSGPWVDVLAWAGPWTADTRWWEPLTHRRRARFQVVTADGEALLLVVEHGRWHLDALYD